MAGAKKKEIDWQKVDNFLKAGCKGTEIAAALGVHPETLYDRCKEVHNTDFSDYLMQKRAAGDAILRAVQYKAAVEGSTPMQIWLGKQRLEQRDKADTDITSGGQPFTLRELIGFKPE